jgi:Endonuclease/Exonuclease/phosphatase family
MKRLMSLGLAAVGVLITAVAVTTAQAVPKQSDARFATFNLSLNRPAEGQLRSDLADPTADTVFVRQAKNNAEVVQRTRPDVLLINEFDFDPVAADRFRHNFLELSQNGADPITYPYAFIAPSNTGIPTGMDLDNSGGVGGPNDAFGFGFFPGQFGLLVLSRFPIDTAHVRTFQKFLWKDMPGNLIPTPFYSPAEVAILRLSSKSHWDVPIQIGGKTVHFLVSHPTPPVFDGAEDRNGRRNFDEIRLWADYITPGDADYIYDDAGVHGGLKPGSLFVIAGDQNSDPLDGDSVPGAIQQLIEHPLVNTKTTPESAGAVEATALQGGANAAHESDPRFDTADFADTAPGNLHADYVLPRNTLQITDSAVFWPKQDDPLFRLVGVFDFATWGAVGGFPTSDHRLVWVDVAIPSK